jgi:hypothetical protein
MLKFQGLIVILLFLVCPLSSGAQNVAQPGFTPDPVKVEMYLPYLAARHGGPEALETWKQNNLVLYYKELWYYTESFSVKKDHVSEGVPMNARAIDISRFEHQRDPGKEVILLIPGYRDALVLKAGNDLKHKPDYVK